MADNVITPQETQIQVQEQQQPDQSAIKAQIAESMAIALNGGIPPQAAETAQTTQETTQSQEIQTQTVVDPFGVLREKFGYETHDAAIKEIEELRSFKATPKTPELEFDNEESANLFKAWAAGKKSEVRDYLNREAEIERLISTEITKENAADIVKAAMQLKFKELNFSPDEINHRFNKQFGLPPKPVQEIGEEDTDYQARMNQWQSEVTDKQMDLMIEAKLAIPEIKNHKGKLIVPEIESPVDEGYAQYQQMLAQRTQEDEETKKAYKALNSKNVETKLPFKDEANKIEFEFQYEPDADSFNKAIEIASNADLFWQTFINSDGSPNRQLFLESILYALDKNKILTSAMNQAKNATIKAQLPDNSQGGLVRQIAQTQEPSELDKNMRAALAGYGRY